MVLKLLVFAALALFAVIGMGSASAQSAEAPDLTPKYNAAAILEPFELELNQNVTVSPDNITVRFSNVTSDSRCPSDVTCVWQGEVSIQVDVKKDGTDFESIILGTDDGVPIFGNYLIQLLKVEPYPQSTLEILPSDYVVTLAITKTDQVQVPSPLQQFKSGIAIDKIQCKDNLQLVIKASNSSPACVKPETREKLVERGWTN